MTTRSKTLFMHLCVNCGRANGVVSKCAFGLYLQCTQSTSALPMSCHKRMGSFPIFPIFVVQDCTANRTKIDTIFHEQSGTDVAFRIVIGWPTCAFFERECQNHFKYSVLVIFVARVQKCKRHTNASDQTCIYDSSVDYSHLDILSMISCAPTAFYWHAECGFSI